MLHLNLGGVVHFFARYHQHQWHCCIAMAATQGCALTQQVSSEDIAHLRPVLHCQRKAFVNDADGSRDLS